VKKLTQKNKEVLDICLASESPEIKAKVYEILEISELDASDPMFLVLALTGQMRVLLEAAPLELSKLLTAWKETLGISLQSIQGAITLVKETQQQQADTIRETLETVTNNCVEDIKQAGMATTSAIAEANSETLAQASKTATAAAELTNATVALRDEVLADRQINQQVLQNILQQVLDAKTELNQAVDRTKGMYGAMVLLQNKIRLSTALGSIAPLSTLGFAAIGEAIVYGWGLRMYWGDAGNYLTVVKENRTALNYCFTEPGERKPGFTCKVVPQKKK
jgi:hypothetical protein